MDEAVTHATEAVQHAASGIELWQVLVLLAAGVIAVPLFKLAIAKPATRVPLAIMTLMGVGNHMGWDMFPRRLVRSRLGGWLITASHHQRHHDEYRCNYGLYFRWWDRLCGTDRGLSTR